MKSRVMVMLVIATTFFVACQIDSWLAPVPTATPTKTATPIMTVTATPTKTPAPTATVTTLPIVAPWDVVPLPQVEFVVATLVERFESFDVVTGYGVVRGTFVYVGFEQPAFSGELYMAIYAFAKDRWRLVDVVEVDSPLKSESELHRSRELGN